MSRPSFVYVTYIAATAEKVWTALTDGKFTREYWGNRVVESDWKEGSPMVFRKGEGGPDSVRGTVLEVKPAKLLVVSWASVNESGGVKPATKVTYQIDPAGPENVRLTVMHEEHEAGSEVSDDVRNGWPAILSSLKTFLETGKPLDITMRWVQAGNK